MTNEKSTAIIQMPKGRKAMVSFGAIMLSVAVACYGLALMTLVPPILQRYEFCRPGWSVHFPWYYPVVPDRR